MQLVATLGPASWTLAPALQAAGATSFRFNASHLDAAKLRHVLAALHRDVPSADVVVDLQGAKMRLGDIAPRDVARDEPVSFALDPAAGVSLPHPEFFVQAHAGDTLSVDDGRVRFRIAGGNGDRLEAIALDAGRLLPRKGVNLDEHPIALGGLTKRDREAMAVARTFGTATFAFSFMADGREAAWVREAGPGCRVIGKVERREAAASLDTLAARVDGLWICRGDLGAQLGLATLARFVAAVEPSRLRVPVLMAGQVLEHLTRHHDPTRSEVCHLFDLAARGYAGVVLSDETAIGADPVNAVRVARSLLDGFDAGR